MSIVEVCGLQTMPERMFLSLSSPSAEIEEVDTSKQDSHDPTRHFEENIKKKKEG